MRAVDADTGDSGTVEYSISDVIVTSGSLSQNDVFSKVEIEDSGDIYFNGVILEGSAFVITVKAADKGRFPR